jgi:hypothetical protein
LRRAGARMLRSQGTPTHCGSSIMAEHRQPVRVTARARQPQISHRTTSCRLRSRSQSDWPDTWIRSLGATAPLPKMRWRMTASGRKLRAGTPPKKGGGRRMGEEPPAFISAKRHPPQTTRKRFHRTHGPHVPRRCRLTLRGSATCRSELHRYHRSHIHRRSATACWLKDERRHVPALPALSSDHNRLCGPSARRARCGRRHSYTRARKHHVSRLRRTSSNPSSRRRDLIVRPMLDLGSASTPTQRRGAWEVAGPIFS